MDITVNEDGEFSYSHSVLRLREGDRVIFRSPDGPLSLHFGDRSPFGQVNVRTDRGQRMTAPMQVKTGAAGKKYTYMVSVYDERNDQVFFDSCPDIIVDC